MKHLILVLLCFLGQMSATKATAQETAVLTEPPTDKTAEIAVYNAKSLAFEQQDGAEIVYDKKGNLFTGAVELADDDGIITSYVYENGQKNGVAVSYYDNRQIRLETSYKNGRKNGAEVMFATDGKPQYQRNYTNDILDGQEILYHPNGKPQKRSDYVLGKLNGKVQYFDQEGNLIKSETYQNNVKNGAEEIVENGRLKEENFYVDGKLSGTTKKYSEKYLIEEIPYENGLQEGVHKIYSEKGNLTEIPYSKGKKQGLATVYYSKDRPAQKVQYANDLKNGISEKFYKNGTKSAVEYYKNGKLEGISRYYDEKGYLTDVKYYMSDAEMMAVDLTSNQQIKEIYDAYKEGKLSHYSNRRDMWYTILWLALNTEKDDILQALEKEVKMYALLLDDMAIYQNNPEQFTNTSQHLYFGLNPLGYAINLAAPEEMLQRFIGLKELKNPRGTTALQEAVRLNNPETVKYLLANGANPQVKDEQGNTALLYALKSSADIAVINALLQNHDYIDEPDNLGNTPLAYAIEHNLSADIVAELLKSGAKVQNIKRQQKSGILFYIVHNGYPAQIIAEIIQNGEINPDAEAKEVIPELIRKHDVDLLKKMNFSAAAQNSFSENNRNALWLAYENKAPQEMLDYFWQQGVAAYGIDYLNVSDVQENDSLWLAALRQSDNPMILRLIQSGALGGSYALQSPVVYILTHSYDEEIINATLEQISPKDLELAINGSEQPLWKYLLTERKFDILQKLAKKFTELADFSDENGKTLVDLALETPQDKELRDFVLANIKTETLIRQAIEKNNAEFLQNALQNFPNINMEDETGLTLLMKVAAKFDKPEIIAILLNSGAEINYANSAGATALTEACRYNHVQTAAMLLEHGAEINAAWDGKTCLMLIKPQQEEMLDLLLQNKADIMYKNADGVSVLQTAVLSGNQKLAAHISKQSSAVNEVDADGNNLLMQLALTKSQNVEEISQMAAILIKNGIDVNHRNNNGETALIMFAKNNPELYLPLREQLVLSGAKTDIKDQYGKKADDYFAAAKK